MKKIFLFVLVAILTVIWAIPVSADKLSDAKKQKNAIDSKINSITKQKKTQQKKLNSAIQEKKDILNEQQQKDTEYKRVNEQIGQLNGEIEAINNSITVAEDNYQEQQDLFKTRLKVMYESSNYSYLDALLESKSISDFFARLKYVSLISDRDKELVDELAVAKMDVEYKKKLKEDEKLEKLKLAGDKKEALKSLQVSRADLEEQIRKINSKLDQLNDQEDALIKKSEEITSQIKNLQSKGKYTGGSMVWPCPSSGQVTSYYGMRIHPILKKYKMHTGIDINASSGVSIVAANKGTVIMAGWMSGYGNAVIIDHGGGISTLYAHSSRLLVSVGDKVNAGEVIAKVGSTGLSTGPHLHFEVRRNGSTTNPLSYVSP